MNRLVKGLVNPWEYNLAIKHRCRKMKFFMLTIKLCRSFASGKERPPLVQSQNKDTEKGGKTIQGNKVDSLRKIFSTSELSNRNKENGSPERSKEMWVSLPSQMPSENEQVDKYLDWEDIDSDEEMSSARSLVLPGEVEQTVTYCTPVFDKPIQLKFRTLSVPQLLDSKAQELLGDDVQPFSLDEEFDYDNVAVTPKFSEAELKAIKELSKENRFSIDMVQPLK